MSVTHVYTRQHNVKGLQSSWQGPFEILSRPTRSTLIIKVGITKDGSDRTERRAWGDVKPAFRREGAPEGVRPRRGRPRKQPEQSSSLQSDSSSHNNNNTAEVIAALDFTKPPPMAPNSNSHATDAEPFKLSGPPPWPGFPTKPSSWTASDSELQFINDSIRGVS